MAKKKALFMEKVQVKTPGTNMFDLSHYHQLTMKMGDLVPYLALECIPGDVHHLDTKYLIKMAPMIAPQMTRVKIKVTNFFVPNRLVWPNFEKYYRNDETIKPVHPYLVFDGEGDRLPGRLANYLGVPPPTSGTVNSVNVNAIPFAAIQLIWNEYFRDQNLQDERLFELPDGEISDVSSPTTLWNQLNTLPRKAWDRDLYTSALPFAQKGPQVTIPVGQFEDVPIKRNNNNDADNFVIEGDVDGTPAQTAVPQEETENTAVQPDAMYAETSLLDAEGVSIRNWRKLIRLQEYYEKLARVGSRFIEVLKGFWGTAPADARLQRPEFIMSNTAMMNISEVLNMTGTENAPQGNPSGHGIVANQVGVNTYHVQEPGWIIGFITVIPDTAYYQGLERQMAQRGNVMDAYPWPQFMNLSEVEVKNQEVFAWQGEEDLETFGYQPIYYEYRYKNNRISGDFQNTLLFWTMARKFDDAPHLNEQFVTADPTDRIYAVQDGTDPLWCNISIGINSRRPLPVFGTPTI